MIAPELQPLAQPIDTLTLLPGNPRRGDIEAVARSYDRFGQRKPIVARRDGTVIAGNHQLQAARSLGWTEIAVVYVDDDDITAQAYALADNRTADLGTYDNDALAVMLAEVATSPDLLAATGYDADILADLLADTTLDLTDDLSHDTNALNNGDDIEPPSAARTRPGDVWLLDRHRVICGDSLTVLPTLPADTFHLALTDPPYFDVVEHAWDHQWQTRTEFVAWLRDVVAHLDTLTVDRATIAVFCSPDNAAAVEMMTAERFDILNNIVWRKPDPGRLGLSDTSTLRSFWPLSERIILGEKGANRLGDLTFTRNLVARDLFADIRERLVGWRDAAGLTNRDIDRMLGTRGMAGHYFTGSQWFLPTEDAWSILAPEFARRGVTVEPWHTLQADVAARRAELEQRRDEYAEHRRAFSVDHVDGWELLSDVWTFSPPRGADRPDHPTAKPVDLIDHLLTTMSRPGDLVVDPFGGSGTTLLVAHTRGRIATLVEQEPRYVDLICERFRKVTGIDPVHETTGERFHDRTPTVAHDETLATGAGTLDA